MAKNAQLTRDMGHGRDHSSSGQRRFTVGHPVAWL